LLAALTAAEDDDDDVFAEYEEPDDGGSGGDLGASTSTTTVSRLQRHELPEDGFIWPTTDEEHFADFMPYEHHCMACRGVAFQVDKALRELMPKDGKRSIAEHEYIEAMECRTSIYEDYGLKKLVDKRRHLVGPGLPWDEDPGSVFGGAKWPSRMARFCGNMIGELGEEEVYKLWIEHASKIDYEPVEDWLEHAKKPGAYKPMEKFTSVLCSATCEAGKLVGIAKPEVEEEDDEPTKKRRRRKSKPKEKPKLKGPPQVIKIIEKNKLSKLNKKHKFVLLLFCAPSFPRCEQLEEEFELAARESKFNDDLKETKFVLANTDDVDTFGFELDRGILPAFLLFRKGYMSPKGVSPEQMMQMREAGDFLNYLQGELIWYMRDDEDGFPRGKLEL